MAINENKAPILFPFDPDQLLIQVRAIIQEELRGSQTNPLSPAKDEGIITRREVAKMLNISLVTLNDWVKRGLPSHKQRGKVYFIHSEVMEYIKGRRTRNVQ